jgi:hypothetical protein
MKKSTIVKIVLLALVAVFAFTLVACGGGNTGDTGSGEKITIYLDPNGGDLGDQADEIQVVVGENIGKLPTPTRGGYKFLGWYEDGNERWEIDRKTKAEYDMDAVALWEPLGELVTVDFKLASDESLDDPDHPLYVEVVKGQRLTTALKTLPKASKEDTDDAYFKFVGWQDSKGNEVTITAVIDADITLSPIWETSRFCLGGSENHSWMAWQTVSEATCTTALMNERVCDACGWKQTETVGTPAGHDWGNTSLKVVDQKLVRARTCGVCGRNENDAITPNTTKLFEAPVISGDAFGVANAGALVDNIWGSNVIDPKTGSSISITLDAKDGPAYVETIVIYGIGSAVAYELFVTYADGTTSMIGAGSNNVACQFEVKAEITQIEIVTANSIGGTYFSEIGTFAD